MIEDLVNTLNTDIEGRAFLLTLVRSLEDGLLKPPEASEFLKRLSRIALSKKDISDLSLVPCRHLLEISKEVCSEEPFRECSETVVGVDRVFHVLDRDVFFSDVCGKPRPDFSNRPVDVPRWEEWFDEFNENPVYQRDAKIGGVTTNRAWVSSQDLSGLPVSQIASSLGLAHQFKPNPGEQYALAGVRFSMPNTAHRPNAFDGCGNAFFYVPRKRAIKGQWGKALNLLSLEDDRIAREGSDESVTTRLSVDDMDLKWAYCGSHPAEMPARKRELVDLYLQKEGAVDLAERAVTYL